MMSVFFFRSDAGWLRRHLSFRGSDCLAAINVVLTCIEEHWLGIQNKSKYLSILTKIPKPWDLSIHHPPHGFVVLHDCSFAIFCAIHCCIVYTCVFWCFGFLEIADYIHSQSDSSHPHHRATWLRLVKI